MKNQAGKHKKMLLPSFILIAFIIISVLWANKAITAREFEITSSDIPSSFDGFRITHVSDVHNTSFGKNNKKLLEKLRVTEPDIIAVTGDVIDSRRTDIKTAAEFLEKALEIAPVYYVTGNHEARTKSYSELEDQMNNMGIIIADNTSYSLERNGEKINIYGIKDPSVAAKFDPEIETAVVTRYLEDLNKKDTFSILLSHRPEFFDIYVEGNFDIVLSGHAHGGQFRLPFIGGLLAPGQGLFPEYDSGLYEKDGTHMIVSRGLGNSVFPLRLFNRPEIITVILKNS